MAKKILYVDDEQALLTILSSRLKAHGYETVVVNSGGAALKQVKASPPDLIILDNRLPDIMGLEVCKKLKAEEKTRDIPVIFFTCDVHKGIEQEVIQAGAVGIIYKPVVVELLTLIKRILAGEQIDWANYEP